MSRCNNCNLQIADETDFCPLCQKVLTKDETQNYNMYPDVWIASRKIRLVENIILFLSIVTFSITLSIELLGFNHLIVSIIEGLILIYINVILRLSILGKSGYMFKIVSFIISALGLLFSIDYLTGYREWSVNYVIPIGIIIMDAIIVFLMIFNRRNWQSYMMMQIMTLILSAISMIFVVFGQISNISLCLVAFAASGFLFLGTLIIGDKRARTELKRRFHV